jgi:hypothetical protein
MIIAISLGFVSKPRLTMSTVAPAGECETRKRSRAAPVSASESAAAPIRGGVNPSRRMLGSSSRTKSTRQRAPASTATRCQIRVLRGFEPGDIGCSKKSRAAGPRLGNSRGCFVR